MLFIVHRRQRRGELINTVYLLCTHRSFIYKINTQIGFVKIFIIIIYNFVSSSTHDATLALASESWRTEVSRRGGSRSVVLMQGNTPSRRRVCMRLTLLSEPAASALT